MGISSLLTWPLLGAPGIVHWLTQKLAEAAERELMDENRVRDELLEIQTACDLGEISEEEYIERERLLVARLNAIREVKAEREGR